MECWNTGKKEKIERMQKMKGMDSVFVLIDPAFQYSIIPVFQYVIIPSIR